MANNITKRQSLTLLRKVQRVQCEDCGKHSISLCAYKDNENGKFWFVACATINDKYECVSCYEWRSYAENLQYIEDWIQKIKEN